MYPMKTIKVFLFIVLLAFVTACEHGEYHKQNNATNGEYITVILDSTQVINPEYAELIKPYRQKMDSAMNQEVAYSNKEYFKKKPNGLLNNLVTDILLEELKKTSDINIDFCLLNYGGLRRPLPAGKIIKSDIFQLMPFENEAVLVKLKPVAMHDLFRYIFLSGGQPVSDIEMHFEDSIIQKALISGQAWDSLRSYWVLTSDYTANGGDKMSFFAQRDTMILTSILIRDAIFKHLDSLQKNDILLSADTTERVFFKSTEQTNNKQETPNTKQ